MMNMVSPSSSSSRFFLLCVAFLMVMVRWASGNSEGDALYALRKSLSDPDNVLESWDPNLVSPCTWFHITCNGDSHVTRDDLVISSSDGRKRTVSGPFPPSAICLMLCVHSCRDLGNSNLSGHLVPDLGKLEHLQYLELYKNNIQGTIPPELGHLKNLISLDLYNNNVSGIIPPELGKLKSLVFLRLNDNKLTGRIPRELTKISGLKVVDVSSNNLCGTIPTTGPFEHIPLEKQPFLFFLGPIGPNK
ncbi:hypothetical protein Cgig2_003548 [Carnegiea gigantea]|uniref:Leucine-rich repeat-containing N-terminal plant-type domain-containing protein n=1 Tax=Carnegiea gigantea TaxID=171969 RepID=A0A9Q1Q736_9CARY|nr:hypothetical protein Cgig2_003548 [Carnegiea gigantea]